MQAPIVHMRLCGVVMLLALLANFAGAGESGRGLHKKLYAVPVPGKVVIDGKLDDWDLSGQIYMYVMSESADTRSARFAMMYDKDALYLSGVVRDPNPLMNRHDPKVDAGNGWNGCSWQLRMSVDPGKPYPLTDNTGVRAYNPKLLLMTFWYYTDRQEACMQMSCGMNYKLPRPEWAPYGAVPSNLFEGKYVKAEDGQGYTFEYRIPWSTLNANPVPKAGDLLAGEVQFNYATPDGMTTCGPAGWIYDVMAWPGIPFQDSSCWGKVILSATGNLPKDIVEEGVTPRKPLPLKFNYELPKDSQVTLELFDANNIVRRILIAQGDRAGGKNSEQWDGCDDQGHPLPAGDYIWKGLYHQPITTNSLFAVHNSGHPPYPTDDGKGAWGGDLGVPTCAAAIPGGVLLTWNSCEAGWGIIRCDLTGQRQWGIKDCATYVAADDKRFYTAGSADLPQNAGVRAFSLADGRPMNFGNGKSELPAPDGGEAKVNGVTGLACDGGVLYVSYQARDLVGMFDAASGELKGTLNVPAPRYLAVLPDNSLLVTGGDKVLHVKNGAVSTFAEQHVDQPAGIAIGANSEVFVANDGKLQNVSVFTKDGKYLRGIGKAGGRPVMGHYKKDGMLNPAGIAVDGKGQLWVAESIEAPKRVSLWKAADGALLNEFFGSTDYGAWVWMDPRKPDELYGDDVIWKVDWKKNTCYPFSTIWRASAPNVPGAPCNSYGQPLHVITARNGKQYAWGSVRGIGGTLYIREGDVFKPFAGDAGYVYDYQMHYCYPEVLEHWQKMTPKEKQEYRNGTKLLWQDKNGDHTVQWDEVTKSETIYQSYFDFLDEDLNIWCSTFGAGFICKPVRFEKDGRPVYDFTKREPMPFKTGYDTCLSLDSKEETFYSLTHARKDIPNFARWNMDGKCRWGYPEVTHWQQALGVPVITPGQLAATTGLIGSAGNFVGAVNYFGPYPLFTIDGLYVAMLMRDCRDGKPLGPESPFAEMFGGELVKPDGMNRYFLLTNSQVFEILGLDSVKNLPGGTYRLTESEAKLASDSLSAYAATAAKSHKLSVARGGKKGLETAAPVSKAIDSARNFSARMAYDAANLYVAFEVNSASELVNSFADPQIIFKGGNCLDIQLATDQSADPKRKTPAPGDVRLLVTRKAAADGKTFTSFAVLYRPKIKGFTGQPIVLTSTTGKEPFDSIETTDKVSLDYKKTAAGYTAVATIPLSLLGFAPKPAMRFAVDLGIIYGNATGSQTSARSYWFNNSFSANVTQDIPNESRLEPGEWGEAVVE